MEPTKLNTQVSASDFEMESHHVALQSNIRRCRAVELAGTSLTAVALISGVAILGLSADALKVYENTHVPSDFYLALWPKDLDLRPVQAMVAAGSIAVGLNVLALLTSKMQAIRNRPMISTVTSLSAAAFTLVAAAVAVGLSYAVNPEGHTVQSWTCRWRSVPMQARPYFGTLCAEGEVALGLAVLLIPLEFLVFGIVAYGSVFKAKVEGSVVEGGERKGSPALS